MWQLAVERSACHRAGVEKHFEKPPLMPRVLLALEQYLVLVDEAALQSALDSTFFIAALGVLMAFFFGWRGDTFSQLALCDMTLAGQYSQLLE